MSIFRAKNLIKAYCLKMLIWVDIKKSQSIKVTLRVLRAHFSTGTLLCKFVPNYLTLNIPYIFQLKHTRGGGIFALSLYKDNEYSDRFLISMHYAQNSIFTIFIFIGFKNAQIKKQKSLSFWFFQNLKQLLL